MAPIALRVKAKVLIMTSCAPLSSPTPLPLAHVTLATLASTFTEQARDTPASGPLHSLL